MKARNRFNWSVSAVVFCASLALTVANAGTVAYWNYDQGQAGVPFSQIPVPDLSGNGYTMYGFNPTYGPSYGTDTPDGFGLSQRSVNQDGYTLDPTLNSWSPLTWTIEVAVKLDNISGWRTIIGRDGDPGCLGFPEAPFYLQKNGIDNQFRINFQTVGGQRYVVDYGFVPTPGVWYGVAAASDGTTLKLYLDKNDGNGWVLARSVDLNLANDNRLYTVNDLWTFGRGWWNDWFVDSIVGNLDHVRFSDVALPPESLLPVPEPSSVMLVCLGILFGGLHLRRRSG